MPIVNFDWLMVLGGLSVNLTHLKISKCPSTQPPIYPPMGGGVYTNHKSSNTIELSQLDQD